MPDFCPAEKRFLELRVIAYNDGLVDPRLLPDVMVFLEVARCGSLTRAAERLHTVQSNVSVRIRKLEEALGVRARQ